VIAWGADFKTRTRIDAASSVADIAPTVLAVLGVETGPLPATLTTTRHLLRTDAGRYRASVQISSVAGYDCIDSGARQR
jgi:arylsulfatase A-like enzyme